MLNEPLMKFVQVFIFPYQVAYVETVNVLYHFILCIQRTTEESHHVFPSDAKRSPSFHLVRKTLDFHQEVFRSIRIVVERYRLRQVKHDDAIHLVGKVAQNDAVKFKTHAYAFLMKDAEFIPRDMVNRKPKKRTSRLYSRLHFFVRVAAKDNDAVVKVVLITIARKGIEELGGRF